MIGRLRGILVSDDVDGTIVIDVSGIGYEVTVPLGAVGRARGGAEGSLTLFVHTYVREDQLSLFGFSSTLEREVFRLLIGLPSVGPKLALAVLSALPPAELASAVASGDLKRLNRVPGVGKRTAERLVLELKEKLPKLGEFDTPRAPAPGTGDVAGRLISALTNMGYKQVQAEKAIGTLADRLGVEPVSDLLRAALAELSA